MIALNIIQQVDTSHCSNKRLTGLANNDLSEEETDDYSQFHCDDDVFSFLSYLSLLPTTCVRYGVGERKVEANSLRAQIISKHYAHFKLRFLVGTTTDKRSAASTRKLLRRRAIQIYRRSSCAEALPAKIRSS